MQIKKRKPEQIIVLLRQAEVEIGPFGCPGLPETVQLRADLLSWRIRYGGVKVDEIKGLRELQAENDRLKKIVANQALDIQMTKDVNRGNY